MRLRRKPEANDFLNAHPEYVIADPERLYGKMADVFSTRQPLHIEIGMGKGDFMIGMAKKYPHINFIGIEKYDTVLYVALKKILKEAYLPNLKLIRLDAGDLKNVFQPHEVSRIYLNFSDPWPKSRHYKRRLTYKDYLDIYRHILVEHGVIEQKTDNRVLFEFSLISMNQYPMTFEHISLDLHHSAEAKDNVMTEYEQKFSPNGPIYQLIAHF